MVSVTTAMTSTTGCQPSAAISPSVIRKPSSATPRRSTVRDAKAIPALQRSTSLRKFIAMPSSRANSITGPRIMVGQEGGGRGNDQRCQQAGADPAQGRGAATLERVHHVYSAKATSAREDWRAHQEHQCRRDAGQRQPPQGLEQADPVGQPAGDDRSGREAEEIVGQGQRREGGAVDCRRRQVGDHRARRAGGRRGEEDGQAEQDQLRRPGRNDQVPRSSRTAQTRL